MVGIPSSRAHVKEAHSRSEVQRVDDCTLGTIGVSGRENARHVYFKKYPYLVLEQSPDRFTPHHKCGGHSYGPGPSEVVSREKRRT